MCFKLRKKNKAASDLPEICRFCEHAALINDEANVLCAERGIVSGDYKCRKFSYDPLKRVPKAPPPAPKLDLEIYADDEPEIVTAPEETSLPDGDDTAAEPQPDESIAPDDAAPDADTEAVSEPDDTNDSDADTATASDEIPPVEEETPDAESAEDEEP